MCLLFRILTWLVSPIMMLSRNLKRLWKYLVLSTGLVSLLYFYHSREHIPKYVKIFPPFAGFILSYNTARVNVSVSIPLIIHQSWKTLKVPELLQKWVESCVKLNRDNWEYWFWTDADIENFISKVFPQYFNLYNSYPGPGYKADLFRYLVLYQYGGVYIDLDMECIKPFEPLIHDYRCIIAQEPYLHGHFLSKVGLPYASNAFMACERNHPFFRTVLEALPKSTGWFSWNDVLSATGPTLLTAIYKGYSKSSANVFLADPDWFNPTTDESMRTFMQEACVPSVVETIPLVLKKTELHQELCHHIFSKGFQKMPVKSSYTNHHWTHLWAGARNDPWGVGNSDRTFNIQDLSQA